MAKGSISSFLRSQHLSEVSYQKTQSGSYGSSLKPIFSYWSLIWATFGFGVMGLGWSGIRLGYHTALSVIAFICGVISWASWCMFACGLL